MCLGDCDCPKAIPGPVATFGPPSVLGYNSFCTESGLNMALICAGFDLQLVVKVSEGGVCLLRATHITRVYRVENMKGLKSEQNREECCASIKNNIYIKKLRLSSYGMDS